MGESGRHATWHKSITKEQILHDPFQIYEMSKTVKLIEAECRMVPGAWQREIIICLLFKAWLSGTFVSVELREANGFFSLEEQPLGTFDGTGLKSEGVSPLQASVS
jgi:hypothetical protein